MNAPAERPRGIFVGLTTVDLVLLTPAYPARNEKVTARRQLTCAGGPATNAAVTFAHLGGAATLLSAVGRHPLASIVREDLRAAGVEHRDLAPSRTGAPTVSSIVLTVPPGDRAVVSANAGRLRVELDNGCLREVQRAAVVLVDGHQPEAAIPAARHARAHGVPVVLDGGSWKPGTATLLRHADVAVCSAAFRPPGARSRRDVLRHLLAAGVSRVAVTDGARPIAFRCADGSRGQVPVPRVRVADTLGAGDIFHGALCAFVARTPDRPFSELLAAAARVASRSCRFHGTRAWMGR